MEFPNYMVSLGDYDTLQEAYKSEYSQTASRNGVYLFDGRYHVFDYKSERISNRVANVINDSMAPVKSMVDGKMYDSKSAYYNSLKNTGNRIIETGEKPVTRKQPSTKDLKNDLRQAVERHWN